MQYFKVFILILFFSFSSQVSAKTKDIHNFEVRVAIVDVQSILENSVAILDIRRSIEVISQDIQKYIATKEAEFKKNEEELVKKRGILTEAAFDKEVNDFNKRVSEAQKEIQSRKSRFEQAHAEAVGKVHEATFSIISDLANKYNFNLVLPSSQVFFAKENLNITSEVIQILNTTLKSVKVNYKL